MRYAIKLQVNGDPYEVLVKPSTTLVDVLRDVLHFTGTKVGCNMGECGTCTVLVDGQPATARLTLAIQCQGREILTIEGLSVNGGIHPIQKAFLDNAAYQCGFCTPGMILAVKALLDVTAQPSDQVIKEALAGNICRCTGYLRIFNAVRALRSPVAEQEGAHAIS